jgi:biopolymer transport protein TolQ
MHTDPTFLSLILNASLAVQLIMLILVSLSLFSWYAIFRKARLLRRIRLKTLAFEHDYLSTPDVQHVYQGVINGRKDAVGLERIFAAGMNGFEQTAHLPASARLEFAQRAMKASFQRELDELESHLPFLASVGSVSPYIGLLGTVWGIMNAFMGLSNANQSTLASVAPGIAEALIATALGLFAAIPAVLAYNRYTAEVDRLALRFESFMDDFSNSLQLG